MSTPNHGGLAASAIEGHFEELARALDECVRIDEIGCLRLAAETSDFVRLNHGRIRQPGSVTQAFVDVELIQGSTHASHTITLTGGLDSDRKNLLEAISGLRSVLPDLAPDPHLDLPQTVVSSRHERGHALPPVETIITTVLDAAEGLDLVGLYAGGPMFRGYADTRGQRNWHAANCFNLQWSLYHRADKAVKCGYSGLAWDEHAFAAEMAKAQSELVNIALPPKALGPGKYRAYLSPAAMEDIVSLLCWNGFSGRALATGQSALGRMRGPNGALLDPRVSIDEATADGVAPWFQDEGFTRPAAVPLIEAGRLTGSMISPRTAREFGDVVGASNGANRHEGPESLSMAGGTLPTRDALAALDTGLWIGNLHYLNYSDRNMCRMTGMTRFATFWVEGGKVVAPIDVLRFDDTLYRMLGSNLEALTAETEFLLDSSSYRQRSLASVRVPGALLSEMTFTL